MWMFFTLTNLVIFVLYKKDSKKDSKMSDRTYIIGDSFYDSADFEVINST